MRTMCHNDAEGRVRRLIRNVPCVLAEDVGKPRAVVADCIVTVHRKNTNEYIFRGTRSVDCLRGRCVSVVLSERYIKAGKSVGLIEIFGSLVIAQTMEAAGILFAVFIER